MATLEHPLATHHLPAFITAPGETDIMLVVMAVILIGVVLAAGVFFFWLHSLPERMVHNKVQFDIVVVLALLSLFTHIHAFWVAALLIALIDFSTFSFTSSFNRLVVAQEKLAGIEAKTVEPVPSASDHAPDKAA
jgi:multisubunit Na+/H+ antiporter MnhF subunit